MRVLVTGATGFLGSWLVRRLVDEGLDVVVMKRHPEEKGRYGDLKVAEVIGDVTNPESLVAASKNIDSVFHLAGLIAYSRKERPAMEAINVQGTANMIAACKANSIRRMLHLSSVTAIGASFDGTPLNEESEFNVHHLDLGYFETKHKAENLVKAAFKAGDLEPIIINPSTIYGAGDATKGSRSTQLKVASGKFPFYSSGGVNVVAVEDVIDCIIQAWKTGRPGERYIVAGENLLIKDLFQIIADAAGIEPPKIFLPTPVVMGLGRVGSVLEHFGLKGPVSSETAWTSTLYHWFDSSKAQRELGLKPKPARDAVTKSVNWMKEQGLLS